MTRALSTSMLQDKILDDIVDMCKPIRAEVTGDFNVRGGIKTVVKANYFRDENSETGFK